MKRFIPIISILLLGKLPLLSQEPYKINFTTENGLPSNEVYCVYQDTSGFMWFGTENGVSLYDGYTFKNYGLEDGLDQLEINQILRDHSGKVWFSSFYGKVFFFENNKFYPYPFNNILKKYKNKADLVNLRHIDAEGTFYFQIKYVGILLIDKNGHEKLIQPNCGACEVIVKTKFGFVLAESFHNQICPSYLHQRNEAIYLGKRIVYIYKYPFGQPTLYTMKDEKNSSNNSQVFSWNDSINFYTLYHKVYVFDNKTLKTEMTVPQSVNFFFKDEEDMYLGLRNKGGLFIYRNWKPDTGIISPEQWLNGTEVSYIIRDKNDGLWATSINEGIYYYPNDKVKIYKSSANQKSQKVTAFYPTGLSKANAVSFYGVLYTVNSNNIDWMLPIKECSNAPDIMVQKENLYIKGNHVSPDKIIRVNKELFPSRFEKKPKTDAFFGSDRFYLFLFNPSIGKFDVVLDEKINSEHIFDLFRETNGILWLATNKGLKTYDNKKLRNVIPKLENIKITSIDQLQDRRMIIGTKGKGLYLLDTSHNIVSNITTKDGLTSNMIEYVWVDDSDNIWVATLKGLNKIKIDRAHKTSIRQYHKNHGLSSEEILMVRTYGDEVWLATGDGLNYFRNYESDTTTFTPKLIDFTVNGVVKPPLDNLDYQDNIIKICIRNFDLSMGSLITYRYKLNSGDNWTMQTSNIFNFLNLNPGKYPLEIQAKNKDGYWSKSLIIPFNINKPWWSTWYFRIFAFWATITLIYTYYRNSVSKINAAHKLKSQLLSYEKKALLAQMNPHFIFNAFSAIQFYINTHDIKKADDFLTDFSSLIRKILDTSFKSDVTLEAELSLVKLYISLEQKRFDHSFDFQIDIDENLDMDTIILPPMLIQPLVENAINHGIIPMQNNEGLLTISIIEHGNSLSVKVSDNGVGMQTKTTNQNTNHQSYGLQIIHDRINSYNKSGEYLITLRNETNSPNDKMQGTTFELIITRTSL